MSLASNDLVEVDTSAWPSSYYGRSKRVDLEKFFQKVQREQEQVEQLRLEQLENEEKKKAKGKVRFSCEPPTVFVYEAEYDTFDRLVSSLEQSKDIWPSYARRPPQRLDLRPIRNQQYGTPSPCINTTYTTSPSSPLPQQQQLSSSSSSSPSPSPSPLLASALLYSQQQQRSPSSSHQEYVSPAQRRPSSSSSSSSSVTSTPPLSPLPCLSPSDDSSDEDEQPSPTVQLTPSSLPFSPTTLTKKFTSVFTRKKRPSLSSSTST